MKEKRKGGFTMTELVVVLVILSVIAAIAIPATYYYIKRAEFRKNEENAKTIYMAAESMLTHYRSSGQWKDFKEEVLRDGIENSSFGEEEKEYGRIYALTLDRGAYAKGNTREKNLVCRLLDDMTYDSGLLEDGAIAVEIDVEAGQIYSAFYATRCDRLDYAEEDSEDHRTLTMNRRDYKSRSKRLLGYYSVEDVANVVDLEPAQLKINNLHLQNGETLSLNWSTNSRHSNLDLNFAVKFYQKSRTQGEPDRELFATDIDLLDLRTAGWDAAQGSTANIAMLELTAKEDDGGQTLAEDTPEESEEPRKSLGTWGFPVIYENGTISLVLDAMMSADALAAFDKEGLEAAQMHALRASSDMSITRLAAYQDGEGHAPLQELAKPQDIYATVKATSTYQNMEGDEREYKGSANAKSNEANTLYADGTTVDASGLQAKITMFRHLSNMRYCAGGHNAVFTVTNQEMDWNSVGVGLYDYQETSPAGDTVQAEETLLKLAWKNGASLQFPSIPLLPENHTLTGLEEGGEEAAKIVNLRLGTDSVIGDVRAEELATEAEGNVSANPSYTKYAGLFRESEGEIRSLNFVQPSITFPQEEDGESFDYLQGIGIVAGRSGGVLEDVAVTADSADTVIANVWIPDRTKGTTTPEEEGTAAAEQIAGIGGIAGVLANETSDGTLAAITEDDKVEGLSVSGKITARVPDPGSAETETEVESKAAGYRYGIGGIAGYLSAGGKFTMKDCENHADVSGNLMTGGICGSADGNYQSQKDDGEEHITMQNCMNDGLILCTESHAMTDQRIEGRYFGGVVGFGKKILLRHVSAASGRSSGFRYDENQKKDLKGQYVGGILGYGTDSLLRECRTERNGYVLGSDYVGGIVGGMRKEDGSRLIESGTSVTTNASYVIGHTYVGGIVGFNDENNQITECVNNGVAAGYDKYIGGIVGYNATNAVIYDCASFLSDYSGGIYHMIVTTWGANGDCVGGLAGYNNGRIEFKDEAQKHNVKSVSSIVAGRDYVGGVVGFNDVHGTMDTTYTLIGGRIYASGDCAGGCVGLNASPAFATQKIEMKPQSVEGNYYVGGCIGANMLNLQDDITMDGFSVNNGIGSLKAQAFAGGVIGYHRTYTDAQLKKYQSGYDSEKDSLYEYLTAAADRKSQFLPQLDRQNVPEIDEPSVNPYRLTVTMSGNQNLAKASNNLSVSAEAYAGGIVGAAENNSRLEIINCKNEGKLSRSTDSGRKVNISAYLMKDGYQAAANAVMTTRVSPMIGGVIGVNGKNHVIENCRNSGTMTGIDGLGGIVGLNEGQVSNCEQSGNFGNAALETVGGIVGYNVGLVEKNRCKANITVTGNFAVGGIAGHNLPGGVLTSNQSYANITAASDYAGGFAGINDGVVYVTADDSQKTRTILGRNGQGVGGIVGLNKETGKISISGTARELIAVNDKARIRGNQKIGGIVGINLGSFDTVDGQTLVCRAEEVRAYGGYAGGIAGTTTGKIENAVNRSAKVSADTGLAGGIVPENHAEIVNCRNEGSVNSNHGYAGGITAVNKGTLRSCTVQGNGTRQITVGSKSVSECGAVAAVNEAGARIYASIPGTSVRLTGTGTVFGGIVGVNQGEIYGKSGVDGAVLVNMPEITSTASALTIGGAAGINQKLVTEITAQEKFENFSGYRYLGGITGFNAAGAAVTDCSYDGTMTEKSSAAGNCYGGITGLNSGTLEKCGIPKIVMTIEGVYTATSTSTAAQKEQMAAHIGAVAGKNETAGRIIDCVIANHTESSLSVKSGMLGGVAGYNKGTISGSGDASLTEKVKASVKADDMSGLGTVDSTYITYRSGTNVAVEDLSYSDNTNHKVTNQRIKMIVSTNGNLGGITAYNAPTGIVERSASGNWFLNNKSQAIGVGTGGMIGMNESEQNQTFLLNQAFVGRQLRSGVTDRFAGGIIGNQNNTTTSDWKIENCVNFGTVYCHNTHYSGGILGQWTGTGGTIENCRNYGNLQTTYGTGWLGASGGIVAQLYHAQEDNDYNIISCGNFGNIYGQAGKRGTVSATNMATNSANDSAGILGNVTNYVSRDAARSQKYTIRVLDCVNGPGVEIYSGSMASGIVGFFSDDDTNQNHADIARSTANTKLVIERCRNFASVMKGGGSGKFSTGIFGERYGDVRPEDIGVQNTLLYDNISVNPKDYSRQNFPVISFDTASSKRGASFKDGVNCGGNYYFESGTTSFDTRNRAVYESASAQAGTGTAFTYNNPAAGDDRLRAGTNRAYVIQNKTTGGYLLVALGYGRTLTPANVRIDPGTWDIVDKNHVKCGKVLCTLNQTAYTNVSDIVTKGNPYYELVRSRYRRMEGLDASGIRLLAPQAAAVSVADGKLEVKVTPQNLLNPPADYAAGAPESSRYKRADPFKYEVGLLKDGSIDPSKITDADVESTGAYIYSEEGSVAIPQNASGQLSVCVRAVSMYDDVAPSPWIKAASDSDNKLVLPAPEIRAELVKNNNNYVYQITLANKKDYENYSANWQVELKFAGSNAGYSLTKDGIVTLTGKADIQQIVAQAVPVNDSSLTESVKTSVSAYMPNYYPSISLTANGGTGQARVLAPVVTGTTLEDLSVSVTLDASASGIVTTPPIYRVELVGTWKKGTNEARTNTVLASEDVLISAGGMATAVFDSLADDIRNASDLKVRVWYAESGLGPVYTWHEVEVPEGTKPTAVGGGVNIYTLNDVIEEVKEDGTKTVTENWTYAFSTVLANNSKTGTGSGTNFNNYTYLSGNVLEWLPAPVLEDQRGNPLEDGVLLDPTYDADGRLHYVFRWDSRNYGNGANEYRVKLYGIDGDNRVAVNTDGIAIDKTDAANQKQVYVLNVDADDWNYTDVEIQVTRVGTNGGTGRPQIGLTSAGTFRVRRRLPKPAQPTVVIENSDELNYRIGWEGIVPEDGCGAYDVYVREYDETDGTYGAPKELRKNIPVDRTGKGLYEITEALDAYAGCQVQIYIVAVAQDNSEAYVNSTPGIGYEMKVLRRLPKPKVSFRTGWKYDRARPLTMAQYRNGGLEVFVDVQNAASIPPGGSTYLLRAYIFDTQKAAEDAIQNVANPDPSVSSNAMNGAKAAYATDDQGNIQPVAMDSVDAAQMKYEHVMTDLSTDYAGKWIVFQTRISAGDGNISSPWTTDGEARRLPYVKLNQTAVSSYTKALPLPVMVTTNPDIPAAEKTWSSKRTVFEWDSVRHADTYYVSITDRNQKEHELRIVETTALKPGQTIPGPAVQIQEKVVVQNGAQTTERWQIVQIDADGDGKAEEDVIFRDQMTKPGEPERTLALNFDQVQVKENYLDANGAVYRYETVLSAQLQITPSADGTSYRYTFALPDVESISDEKGSRVTGAKKYSKRIRFRADVLANAQTDQSLQSDAYVSSDEKTIQLDK